MGARLAALASLLALVGLSISIVSTPHRSATARSSDQVSSAYLLTRDSGNVAAAEPSATLTSFQSVSDAPRMICGGNPGQCGSFEYFIPGSWWGYPWDHNNITYGYWHPTLSASGAVNGCLASFAAGAAWAALGGAVTLGGLVFACVVTGAIGGLQLGVAGQ